MTAIQTIRGVQFQPGSNISDCIIITPTQFPDNRGYFEETYNQQVFQEYGIFANFCQDNQSLSHSGTVRGLHYQLPPFAQAKLVRVVAGSVLDIAVDLRPGPNFGRVETVEISADNHKQFYIPRGCAHGFVVTSPADAVFLYKVDNVYNKENSAGFNILDSRWGLSSQFSPSNPSLIISPADANLPSFDQVSAGLKQINWE